MELVNTTRLAADYTVGIDPAAREHLVVVVKGTFDIPSTPGKPVALSAEQVPVAIADVLGGDSGALPIDDADLCLRKPRCDVILKGCAYSPEGRPATRVEVGIRVGDWTKRFYVVGDRRWIVGGLSTRMTQPVPFEVMPISYERAFGGVDVNVRNSADAHTYRSNPVGRGYRSRADRIVDGESLPNTEQLDRPIVRPDGTYVPMSFGPVGRSWFPRYAFAGTYDQHWQDDVFPFLLEDFDDRDHQSAPADQQIAFAAGGEDVVLVNLSPEGRSAFRLPRVEACITVAPRHADREELPAVIDTITIEPDARRFTLSWRCSRPLRRSLFEIDEVIVGRVGAKFLRERDGLPLPYPVWAGRSARTQRDPAHSEPPVSQ
jgi:hypothetical protein